MPRIACASSFFRNLRRLTLPGISSLSTWFRRRRTSRAADAFAYYPRLDPFEGRFYPGSILAWSMPVWVGGAYMVDQALTAARSEEEVYWEEARAVTSLQEASANANPWAEPATPAAETSGAATLDSPSGRPVGNAAAPAIEPDQGQTGFSFGALADPDDGLADPWTRDLFAGLLGSARPAARSSGSGQAARELSANIASGMGMLGSGSVAAPPSAGPTPASNPVAASAAATVPDEALLSALASLSVVPSPAAAPAAATLGTPTGSGGSGSNGPPPPSAPRSHQGVPHGRGPVHSKDPLWVIDVNKCPPFRNDCRFFAING